MRCTAVLCLLAGLGVLPSTHLRAEEDAITASDIERVVRTLAADEMGGRFTPSAGLDAAVQFVAEEMAARGLASWPSRGNYRQPYTVLRQRVQLSGSTLTLRGPGGAVLTVNLEDEAIYLDGSPRTLHDLPVLVAPVDAELDPRQVAGHLLVRVAPANMEHATARYRALEQRTPNAAAVVAISADSEDGFRARLGRPGWRGPDGRIVAMLDPFELAVDSRLVALPGNEERLTRIRPFLEVAPGSAVAQMAGSSDGAGWRADLDLRGALEPAEVANVLGWVPAAGADPSAPNTAELIVVTAHLDHLGTLPVDGDAVMNGADDNASGVAALLAVAGAVATEKAPQGRAILFAATSGEEHGNWGATALVEALHAGNHTVAAVVNLDMIGRNEAGAISAITSPGSGLDNLARELVAADPSLPLAVNGNRWPSDRLEEASDHAPFGAAQIPWLFFFAGTHADYHQVSDEAELIDFDKVAQVARLARRVVRHLADEMSGN